MIGDDDGDDDDNDDDDDDDDDKEFVFTGLMIYSAFTGVYTAMA